MNAEIHKKLALIVASHDKSSDLWDPLFEMLERNWPECPFPVYLVCNFAEYRRSGVTTLAVGADLSWSETLRTALDRVPVDYVLLWIDDHFVIERVNNADIMAAIKGFLSVQGNY